MNVTFVSVYRITGKAFLVVLAFCIIYAKGWYEFQFDTTSLILFALIVFLMLFSMQECLALLGKYFESFSMTTRGISVKTREKIEVKLEDVESYFHSFLTKVDTTKIDVPAAVSLTDESTLVLISLRVEIERRINDLLETHGIDCRSGLHQKIEALYKKEVLPESLVSLLRDVRPLCNKAAHGLVRTTDDISWVKGVSARIISVLDALLKKGKEEA